MFDMKRSLAAATILLAAVTAVAQPAQTDADKVVAVVNGETITKSKLDALYANMSAEMRSQYDRSGGKMAFLDNYVAKRLLIQEAMKSGFDKRPAVQAALEAARDSALFDKYVRDVIAANVVQESEVRKYYDDHKADFSIPETRKVRHIVITWNQRPKPEALELAKRIATEIRAGAP